MTKFEAAQIHFLSEVFAAVAVVTVVKTSFKSEFACFLVIIQTRLLVKCWRTLLKSKSCSEPPWHRNVKKNNNNKKWDVWANSGFACVLLALLTPPDEMLSLILFTVNCIFNLGVVQN